MSNVRDLFATSANNAHLGYSLRREATSAYFVIDGEARTITPPSTFKHFGVESDEKTARIWFEAPQIVGDNIDLATLNLRVNFKNANGDKDIYIVDDVEADGSNIRFSWLLSRKVTLYKGTVSFIVCAIKTSSGGEVQNEWNTTLCTGSVLEGLEATSPEVEESASDLISQLVDMINGATNDVNNAKAEALSDIEDAKEEALSAIGKADTTPLANSLKATASGEVVRVDDVSPLEHTAKVKISGENIDMTTVTVTRCGKNLLNFTPYTTNSEGATTQTFEAPILPVGATFFLHGFFDDGGALASGNCAFVFRKGSTQLLNTAPNVAVTVTEEIAQADTVAIYTNATVAGKTVAKFQIEIGTNPSDYEQYKEATTYTPDADGTVDIVSVSPTMTLLTDTAGVNIELEYNQDINAAMDNVKKDIAEVDRMIAEVTNVISDIEKSLDNVIAKYELGGDVE